MGQCAADHARAAGGGVAGRPAIQRSRAGRSAAREPRPPMWWRRAIRGPMSRMHPWRRPARWRNIAMGICRCGRTRRASYPLRTALANVLGIAQDAITVRHAHGAGCYGHNGADDVAVDAAVIAMQMPGSLHPRAMAARGGVRLRAGRPGDAHHAARRARRCGKTRGLDCAKSGRRRMCSGRAAAATC